MIQDIFPQQLCNQYKKREAVADSRIMIFCGRKICIRKGDLLDFPKKGRVAAWCNAAEKNFPKLTYLFSITQNQTSDSVEGITDYFLADLPEDLVVLEGIDKNRYIFVPMFDIRKKAPKDQVLAAATAWHLAVWYRDNRYCGRCGHTLAHSETMRMLQCPKCGNQVFPKIAPAVIVGVIDGDRILMTKYANRDYKHYALIAGFTEIGETAEETVKREVMEEVGLRVKNIRYYKSQPWGFDSDLLLGYFCELDDDGEMHIDERELSAAEWVKRCDVPDDPEGFSLTREMMTYFKEGRAFQ